MRHAGVTDQVCEFLESAVDRAQRSGKLISSMPPIAIPTLFLTFLVGLTAMPAWAAPPNLKSMLPMQYRVIGTAEIRPAPSSRFYIVALAREDEAGPSDEAHATARPLLIFKLAGNQARLVSRNDHVVLRANEGGQCDPFTDADKPIVAKGRFFTVENGVACGSHWTDYITFRFDERTNDFIFDNERSENWMFNKSDDPNAEALVQDGPQVVRRPPPGQIVTFSAWRPKR